VPRVEVRPWVVSDLGSLLTRPAVGRVLFDLHNHLPRNLALYQPKRIPKSARCFWYDRVYSEANKLHGLAFVVRDSDPGLLDVIWVEHTG
jgi:hypothetical protein